MADALDVNHWSPNRARRARKVARLRLALSPNEVLDARIGADGDLMGPYETKYSVAYGYENRETDQP